MPALERLRDQTADELTQHRSVDFVRYLSCLAEHAMPSLASRHFLDRWPRSLSRDFVEKAATAAGSTTDPAWGGALAGSPLLAGFLALARSASLLGRLPTLRQIPFNATLPTQTQAGAFFWVQAGTPKPITALAFDPGIRLAATKCAGTIVVSEELLKLTIPGTERAVRDTLIAGLTLFTDTAFLDPASTAIANVRPGSITAGLTPIAGTGDLVKDVGALLDAFFAGRPGAIDATLVLSPANAARLTGVTGTPGTAFGLPVVPTEAAGTTVVVLDPPGVGVADNGILVDIARHASVQMESAPDNPQLATSVMTSLWQHNLVGVRVERFVNWQAVPGAVAYLTTGA